MTKLLGISGSLRKDSFTRRVLSTIEDLVDGSATIDTADIESIPHYNADLDGDHRPTSVERLIDQIERADGLLIVTPEYNYAIPGVLKNAIDWASRPAYRSPLAHKPAAILAASPGPVGGARALANLRQILGGTVTDVFPHPEFLIAQVHQKFPSEGPIDPTTRQHLERLVVDFVEWAKERSTAKAKG